MPSTHPGMAPAALAAFLLAAPVPLPGQQPGEPAAPPPRGWEFAGVPTVNFDSDEGFGYGAVVELYDYGDGSVRPYRLTVQPTLLLTTEGRRDLTVFVDAPGVLPRGWRLDAFLGREAHVATPYYGLGNATRIDPARDDDPDHPYYYRFGRTRWTGAANLQRPIPRLPLRGLVGVGAAHTSVDAQPFGIGTTLLAELSAGTPLPGGWTNTLRGGLVWDSRDREVGATRGTWSELLVQRSEPLLGSDHAFTRWTLTDRRYVGFGTPRLVFANRLLLQGVEGDAPFYELFIVQTSFKQQEGLGGAKTLRGLPKNRYVGEGLFLWNAELRWRAADFRLVGRPFHAVLSGFVDSGRVWEDGVRPKEILSDLHHGVGGGLRLGMGENFVIAVDRGQSSDGGALYIGLGYLY
jgi:hypothetical protein